MGSNIYFGATNGRAGHELWKSDGTSDGTTMVKDIETGGEGDGLASASAAVKVVALLLK